MQTINIIQTELFVFYVLRIHTNNKEKEAMHLKDNKGDYMGETGEMKRKGGNAAIIL